MGVEIGEETARWKEAEKEIALQCWRIAVHQIAPLTLG
jgi:hypothetical protein